MFGRGGSSGKAMSYTHLLKAARLKLYKNVLFNYNNIMGDKLLLKFGAKFQP